MREKSKKRLGELLIEDGSLQREELNEALDFQKKNGGMIGQILIRLGYITEENLVAALGKQLKIPYIPLVNYSINMDAAQILDKEFCLQRMMMAFDQDEKKIFVAIADPLLDSAIEEIQNRTALRPQIFISTPTEIANMLDLVFAAAKKKLKKAG